MGTGIDVTLGEHLGHYVYELLDPTTNPPRVFYVGEGIKGRVLSHLTDGRPLDPAALQESSSEVAQSRLDRIKAIRKANKEPELRIAIYGLADKATARAVEATLIATYLRMGFDLANLNGGYHHNRVGLDLNTLRAKLGAADCRVEGPAILVKCDFLHRPLPSGIMPWDASDSLRRYNAQRFWTLSDKKADELARLIGGGTQVPLLAVTHDSICLGAWPIARYDRNSNMFNLKPALVATYLKKRLTKRADTYWTAQPGQVYVNWPV